jgi:hypothetical protein
VEEVAQKVETMAVKEPESPTGEKAAEEEPAAASKPVVEDDTLNFDGREHLNLVFIGHVAGAYTRPLFSST